MSKKYYFAAANSYGSESSTGFANTWFVKAFESMKDRDDWVYGTNRIDVLAIKKSEISGYIGKPKPFSGEYLAITRDQFSDGMNVEITDVYDNHRLLRRLYA